MVRDRIAIVKALNEVGIIAEKQFKIHFDPIQKLGKNIGEISVEKSRRLSSAERSPQ